MSNHIDLHMHSNCSDDGEYTPAELVRQCKEAYCSYHDKKTAEYFYKKAKQNSLIITCGSDYHGKTKPAVKLGKTGCPLDKKTMNHQIDLLCK